MRKCVTITACYLTQSMGVKRFCLTMKHFEESHTIDNVSKFLREQVNALLDDTILIHGCVTDNAANFAGAATKYVGSDGAWPCFAHSLQLVVKDFIESSASFGRSISHVHDFVEKIIGSPNLAKAFRDFTRARAMKHTTLLQSCETRWSSVFFMLERFLSFQDVIPDFIRTVKADVPIFRIMCDGFERIIKSVAHLIFILEPFKTATIASQQAHTCVGHVVLWLNEIEHTLGSVKLTQPDLSSIVSTAEHLLQERFKYVRSTPNVALMAAALHPMLCHMPGVTEEVKDATWEHLLDHVIELEPKPTGLVKGRIDQKIILQRQMHSLQLKDLRQYLESSSLKDLETFWSSSCPWAVEIGPYKPLARLVLSLPPTSAESESTFSTAGFLQRDRELVSDDVLNMQVVINRASPSDPQELRKYLEGIIKFIRTKNNLDENYFPDSLPALAHDILPLE
jgi:hypothetical protein